MIIVSKRGEQILKKYLNEHISDFDFERDAVYVKVERGFTFPDDQSFSNDLSEEPQRTRLYAKIIKNDGFVISLDLGNDFFIKNFIVTIE
jgi:hypothetical protein